MVVRTDMREAPKAQLSLLACPAGPVNRARVTVVNQASTGAGQLGRMRRRLVLAAVLSFATLSALAPARAEEAGARSKRTGAATFVPMPTLTANTQRADGRRGVFSVESGVDVPDPALRERVTGLAPALIDAYATTVRVFAGALRPGQVPDLDALEARLQADTDRIVGRRGTRVLLGTCLVD
jgi:hypothetical protein